MNLLDNVLKRMGYTKAGYKVESWLRETAAVEKWEVPDPTIYENQMILRGKSSWIDGAMRIVANQCATSKLNVKRMEGEKLVDIPNHPLEKLLRNPNPVEGYFELMNITATSYKLHGNAYWWLNIVNGTVYEIWPIEPHRIVPIPDGNLYLAGYMYYPGDGKEHALPVEQIVHIKQITGRNRFIGIGDIESIALAATNDIEMVKWNAKLFGESNAKLPGIIAFKDMINNTDWKQIKDDIRDAAAKQQYMLLRGVGDSVTWMQNTYSQKDMEFLASRTFTKEEVYNVIAPGLASQLAVNATEANSRAGKETLMELAVYPVLSAIAEKITSQLLPYFGEGLVGEFDDPRVVDKQMRMREIEVYSTTHTIDEIREEFYGDKKLGDERGEMLPKQIKPGDMMLGIDEPMTPQQQPQQLQEPKTPQQEQANDMPNDISAEQKALDEWRKFEAKAIKAFEGGKINKLKFGAEYVDQVLIDAVIGELETAKSADEIKKTIVDNRDWKDYP